ncbi:hypothetical protein CR513_41307, partial [Mucuna pruriens]
MGLTSDIYPAVACYKQVFRMVSLNDTNYHLWRRKMKDLLFVKKMHLPNPCLMKNETLSINKYVVLSDILWMIMFIITLQVRTHASTLWEKIESLYASKYGSNKLFLLNSIVSLKFKEDTFLSDHLNEFQGILDQMLRVGIKFEDEILGLLLLNSLSESWETFKVSITNSTLNGVVHVQMAKDREKSKKGREKNRSKFKSKYKNVKCHYCHKTGYIHKHCFLWEKKNKDKKGKLKEKDHDDDGRVTIAIGDDLVIL